MKVEAKDNQIIITLEDSDIASGMPMDAMVDAMVQGMLLVLGDKEVQERISDILPKEFNQKLKATLQDLREKWELFDG